MYKYSEDKTLTELKEYIDSTYDLHYSKNRFQATEFIIDGGHGEGFCIGNILKMKRNIFILLVKKNKGTYFLLTLFCFNIYAEPSHKIRLINGPAIAIAALWKCVAKPEWVTYPGMKKINPKFNSPRCRRIA